MTSVVVILVLSILFSVLFKDKKQGNQPFETHEEFDQMPIPQVQTAAASSDDNGYQTENRSDINTNKNTVDNKVNQNNVSGFNLKKAVIYSSVLERPYK
ncbi:MAG: hypothetical protein J6M30_00400 [Bacteroidales bacterium]|nr:hypothetical protein [Bacteroidales bacterium]